MYILYLNGLALPVTPSKLQMDMKNRNSTMALIDGSEINLIKAPGLTEIKFDALLPAVPYPFSYYEDGFQEPDIYLTWLELLKKQNNPFPLRLVRRFSDGRETFEKNMNVTLESYSIEESTDHGMDTMVSIELKQYVHFKTVRTEIEESPSGGRVQIKETVERPARKTAKTYTVKKGDTLWGICKKQLGNGAKYSEIAKLNKIVNPDLIHPGQVIRFE